MILVANIIIIDDDYATEILAENLRYRGHDVRRIPTAQDALSSLESIASAHLLILDIIMPPPSSYLHGQVSGGRSTGMSIYREVRSLNAELPVLVFSATQDRDLVDTLYDDKHTEFLSKWGASSMKEVVATVHTFLGICPTSMLPTVFIVHGHDDRTKLELKNYLQNVLRLPEPIILHEQPDHGRTLIEKLEDYAGCSDLALVVLTPDDKMATPDGTNADKRCARQNVIFEMGYFLGVLGRKSGRVILLHKGPLDMPSDLSGVIYVDISNGIEAAGEHLRKELQHVLQ